MKLWSKETAAIIAVTVGISLGLFYLMMTGPSDTLNSPDVMSGIDYYKSQICHPKSIDTKCTLLAPTYRRVRLLPVFMNNYCNLTSSLEKIVMVWNDVESPIPPSVLKLVEKCKVEVKFIAMETNKLSNRFLPGEYLNEVETECECNFLSNGSFRCSPFWERPNLSSLESWGEWLDGIFPTQTDS